MKWFDTYFIHNSLRKWEHKFKDCYGHLEVIKSELFGVLPMTQKLFQKKVLSFIKTGQTAK